jgi:phospholipid transport system substrate-binding protein
LLGVLAAGALAGLAAVSPAGAAPSDGAARLIDELARQTIDIVADKGLDRAARAEKLLALLDKGFDGDTISRFVLGNHWRTATDAEKREFMEVFREFTALSYAKRFEAYSGQKLEILGIRDQTTDKGKRKAMVQSELTRSDGTPVKVDWRVREAGDGWRIYDVVVEGVSMLLTQRSEFTAVIQQQGGMSGLLQQLRKRTARLGQEGSAG